MQAHTCSLALWCCALHIRRVYLAFSPQTQRTFLLLGLPMADMIFNLPSSLNGQGFSGLREVSFLRFFPALRQEMGLKSEHVQSPYVHETTKTVSVVRRFLRDHWARFFAVFLNGDVKALIIFACILQTELARLWCCPRGFPITTAAWTKPKIYVSITAIPYLWRLRAMAFVMYLVSVPSFFLL